MLCELKNLPPANGIDTSVWAGVSTLCALEVNDMLGLTKVLNEVKNSDVC